MTRRHYKIDKDSPLGKELKKLAEEKKRILFQIENKLPISKKWD